jgi:hypothetical protein
LLATSAPAAHVLHRAFRGLKFLANFTNPGRTLR